TFWTSALRTLATAAIDWPDWSAVWRSLVLMPMALAAMARSSPSSLGPCPNPPGPPGPWSPRAGWAAAKAAATESAWAWLMVPASTSFLRASVTHWGAVFGWAATVVDVVDAVWAP